jgi:hypothetical protein
LVLKQILKCGLPIEIHFPELSADDAEGFVNVLSAQLKEACPDIFTNYENV